MSYYLLAATLVAAPTATDWESKLPSNSAPAVSEIRTGSLIFSEGDCVAVRVFTQSPYTHVAAVAFTDGRPYVYDSLKGHGVRRQPLRKYLNSLTPGVVHVSHPCEAMSNVRWREFVEALESQLGRPYAIKHHLTGKRARGLHCAEYVTDALITCNVIRARRPSRVSPASLAEGLLKTELYTPPEQIVLEPPEPAPVVGSNWCEQLWIDTCACARNCCAKMSGWFLCR